MNKSARISVKIRKHDSKNVLKEEPTKETIKEEVKEEMKDNHHKQFFKKLHIRMPIEKIILTEEEKIEISSINKKIEDLKRSEKPKIEDHRQNLTKIDNNISTKINSKRNFQQNIMDEILSEHPDLSEIIENFESVEDLKRRISELKRNRIDLCKQRQIINDRQNNFQHRFGFRSLFEVENRISELSDEIEVSTLSNKELKRKLAEIDRLKENLKNFQRFDNDDNDLEDINEEIEKISEDINHLSEIIHIFESKTDNIESLNEEIDSLFDAKVEQRNQFHNSIKLFRNIPNEIRALEYERDCIYFLSERRMNEQRANDRKNRLEKIKLHPNQNKIDIARALMEYLNQFKIQNDDDNENSFNQNKNSQSNLNEENDEDEFSMMIRNVRNNRNAKRISKTKKSSKFSFSLETVQQFVTLGLNPPSSVDSIPQSITQLNSIITTFEAQPLVSLYDILS
jgi:hypothetical protein